MTTTSQQSLNDDLFILHCPLKSVEGCFVFFAFFSLYNLVVSNICVNTQALANHRALIYFIFSKFAREAKAFFVDYPCIFPMCPLFNLLNNVALLYKMQ